MDLVLNNLQWLMRHITKPNQINLVIDLLLSDTQLSTRVTGDSHCSTQVTLKAAVPLRLPMLRSYEFVKYLMSDN